MVFEIEDELAIVRLPEGITTTRIFIGTKRVEILQAEDGSIKTKIVDLPR